MKYLTLAARLFIGGLFIYASIYKIGDPANFAVSIRNYMIVPPSWSNILALTLPWIEIGAGGLLDSRHSDETGCIADHRDAGGFPGCSDLCLFHRFGHRLRMLFIGSLVIRP